VRGAIDVNPDFDVRTSRSLLEKLRFFEDRQAWAHFMGLYLPMIQTWARRFGLMNDDVEELTSRLLTKLVEALPQFQYDADKGTFRGWLKTVTQRELATFARERGRKPPGAAGTGHSDVFEMLFELPDAVDSLVDSIYDPSAGMLHSLHEAIAQIEGEHQGAEQVSWQVFQKIFLADEPIEKVAAEFGLTYHAAAMRVQRIKKKVRDRALQLAARRGAKD
jgi:RNA polymerase sigma-70 factor (ECF subfamily)